MKDLVYTAWHIRHEFLKYFVVGVTTVVVDMGVLWALSTGIGVPPTLAVIVSQTAGLLVNFSLNKHWSFQVKGDTRQQFMRYVALVLVNYGVSVTAMAIFHGLLGFEYRLVRLGTIIAMVPINFIAYKIWVYKATMQEDEMHSDE